MVQSYSVNFKKALRKCGMSKKNIFLIALLISGCGEDFSGSKEAKIDEFDFFEPSDPLDEFSRAMMELNFFLDDYILLPAATAYKALTPEIVQLGVGNFTNHLKVPFYLLNDVFQWRWDRFAQNFWIFTVNTAGLGVVNVAAQFDVYVQPNDFGITLHQWGAGPGFDVTLPILGPTNFRDAVGGLVKLVGDPVSVLAVQANYCWESYAVAGVEIVHSRSGYLGMMEGLRKESYDPYVTIKSILQQKRQAELEERK